MPRILSDDEDQLSVRGTPSPPPRGLFSDDDGDRSSDDGGRGHESQAEEDNDPEGEGGRPRSAAGGRNSDDEEAERKREEKRKKDEEKKKKPKGPVRRQMISEDMLIGKNGLSKIPDIFQDFQFGGKGKEKEDLSRVLAKLEHWVHLLHPKQPFDQSLQRIEFLGLKRKVVKTHLKKLRMGMLTNFDDEIIEDDGMQDIDVDVNDIEAAVSENQREQQTSQAGPSTSTASRIVDMDDNDFPDDDDILEMMNNPGTSTSTNKENTQPPRTHQDSDDDMDIDMGAYGDEDDDMFQKQLEMQLRMAEAEAAAKEKENSQKCNNQTEESEDRIEGSPGKISTLPTMETSSKDMEKNVHEQTTVIVTSGKEMDDDNRENVDESLASSELNSNLEKDQETIVVSQNEGQSTPREDNEV